jgi:2-phosphosulfolactate phosphatase
MKIEIFSPDRDAKEIDGFTIVVDVLRAFSVSYYINANRPKKYLVVDSVEKAFSLKESLPGVLLIGERQGLKVPGFDYGNSPTEILNKDFSGATVIHTTTAGTKGLLAQKGENEVVVGSFVNANALVRYIGKNRIERVNVYCTAPKDQAFGEEDYYFGEYLKAILTGGEMDFDSIVGILKKGTGRGFSSDGFAPYSDFEYCMELNRFDVVLRKKPQTGEGLIELEEIPV